MPLLGFGTWTLNGTDGQNIIENAIRTGYRLFDTAQMYQNEEIIGNAVRNSGIARESFFITSKLDFNSNSYQKAKQNIEISLQRLQTDYLDLMLIHGCYPQATEMYSAMQEAWEKGKIRSIGISNFNQQEYLNFVAQCKIIPAVEQAEVHVYHNRKKLQVVLQEHGTALQAWSPFTSGRKKSIFREAVFEEMTEKYQKTAAQIILRYLIQKKISAIPRTVSPERMKENLSVFDFTLDKQEMQKIETLHQEISFFGFPGN